MSNPENMKSSTTRGLSIAPSIEPTLKGQGFSSAPNIANRRMLYLCVLSILSALVVGAVGKGLVLLINFFTNLSFLGKFSVEAANPWGHHLGLWVIVIPSIGGLIVGIMARYGSEGIRGHGLPEAMERVLTSQSKIPPGLTFLKPLSAAIAIGTGGPFGAEGPIIATGAAFGSLGGQILKTTPTERKILLTAGASAGMAAIFGSPVAAVLLAVELLLFEFSPRSLIPVALASLTGAGMHVLFFGSGPVFAMPEIKPVGDIALMIYLLFGAFMGLAAVVATKCVYLVEDLFAKLPLHWMWWPAIGGIFVGIIGYIEPHSMGVGYENIRNSLGDEITLTAMASLALWKFLSWTISLGSGTSGGTLAPLFTIGGALGGAVGILLHQYFPEFGLDPKVTALVGMTAIFSGSARALLTSIIFAVETTMQIHGILPILSGALASYFISFFFMKTSIMTEKIVRKGVNIPDEYVPDLLETVTVGEVCNRNITLILETQNLRQIREQLHEEHVDDIPHSFPVIDENGYFVGSLNWKEIYERRLPEETPSGEIALKNKHVVPSDITLENALDLLVRSQMEAIPVVDKKGKVIGQLNHKDVLEIHKIRMEEQKIQEQSFRFSGLDRFRRKGGD